MWLQLTITNSIPPTNKSLLSCRVLCSQKYVWLTDKMTRNRKSDNFFFLFVMQKLLNQLRWCNLNARERLWLKHSLCWDAIDSKCINNAHDCGVVLCHWWDWRVRLKTIAGSIPWQWGVTRIILDDLKYYAVVNCVKKYACVQNSIQTEARLAVSINDWTINLYSI